MSQSSQLATPRYFRILVHFLRRLPDFDFGFITPVREEAVRRLGLQPGDRALDVGCGPGGSLPVLRAAVGAEGEVVGVEISPPVAALAKRRIARQGWDNVSVQVAPAQTVALHGQYNGLLMFAAPDVYGSPAAMTHLAAHLRPQAGVAFFGAKRSQGRLGWVLNGPMRVLMPRISFATTPVPTEAPWAAWAPLLEDLQVREYFLGWMFLATGRWRGTQSA